MRLLFDENLSRELVRMLADVFPGATHVSNERLESRPDLDIWEFAVTRGFAVVTKDRDFRSLSLLREPPLKVIHVAIGNSSTPECERILRDNRDRIEEFLASETSLLIIERS